MKSRIYLIFALIMLVSDVVMICLANFIAYYVRFLWGVIGFVELHQWQVYLMPVIVEIIIFPTLFAFRGMYRYKRNISKLDELQKIFTVVSVGTILTLAATGFAARELDYSRAVITFAWAGAVILIWIARLIQYQIYNFILWKRSVLNRVLIVGTGEAGRAVLQRIAQSPQLGYAVAGFVGNGFDSNKIDDSNIPVLGKTSEICTLIKDKEVNEVIIAEPSLSHRELLDIVTDCEKENVSIKVYPGLFQIISSEVTIDDLNGLPMVSVRDTALRGWNLIVKRGMDCIVSSIALVLLSPLMLLVALLVKVTSPKDPVFYVQERVGLDGKPFKMIKFRSMKSDAEQETGPVWAKLGDTRTTRLGGFLRRSSIDELPQFVNILVGEMSVVGPRAERPHFVEQFSKKVPRYLERHKEKAGLTGWAQINGLRGDVSIEERTIYDLWYVEHWTPWLDVKIMLRTMITIFSGRNAY